MKLPRFTVRRLMIAVAVVALLLMPIVWCIQLNQALYKFYGPGGTLERQNQGYRNPAFKLGVGLGSPSRWSIV
jgi:hypothetical protein